jgi:superfamily I DNA and/or RNA helicase
LYEADAKETLPFLEDTFLKTSFFEKLYENLPPQCRGRLQDQFRMVEPIGDLVANLFYTDKDKRCLFNGRIHSREHFLDPEHTLRWHSVNGGRQENEIGETSLFNTREAEVILDFLRVASQSRSNRDPQQGDEFRGKHVAIITPYGAQKRLIIRLLDKESKKVNTVDAFQGSEADIVLYSTVRTKGDISFLLDRQRLNVACSRARENLVFFGATKFLREYESRSGKFLFSKIIDASHCS